MIGLAWLEISPVVDRLNAGLGGVAQLGERYVRNVEVVSSILILSTKFIQ